MKAHWGIRFYTPRDYQETVAYVGSYENVGGRENDSVIVFDGIYGVGGYLVWIIQKNLPAYDLDSLELEVKLFIGGDLEACYWRETYKPIEVKFDPNTQKYVLYAINTDAAILKTKLITHKISSISFKEGRTPKQLLEEVLVNNNILGLKYFDKKLKGSLETEYRQLNINERWTVRDFIEYVARENGLEWHVHNKVLFIGREIYPFVDWNSGYDFDPEEDNIGEGVMVRKVVSDPRPMKPLSHLFKSWKCIWVKHIAGKSGGVSKGCFSKIGFGMIPRDTFAETLEADIEKQRAKQFLEETPKHIIKIGNILSDSGENDYVDAVSMQKLPESFNTTYPNDIQISDGKGGPAAKIVNQKEQVPRTVPYADDGAGMFFPRVDVSTPTPNSIVYNIYGKEESSAMGPFLMGDGKEYTPMAKDPDDFRFQLPNGWCLYITSEGDTYIQTDETDPTSVPSEDNQHTVIHFDKNGRILLQKNTNNFILLDDNGDIMIGNEGSTEIISNGEIDIDGLKTKLQGGGNLLSHADHVHGYNHTHQTGNCGIPIPLQSHVGGGINTETHIPAQGTTTTEAD